MIFTYRRPKKQAIIIITKGLLYLSKEFLWNNPVL